MKGGEESRRRGPESRWALELFPPVRLLSNLSSLPSTHKHSPALAISPRIQSSLSSSWHPSALSCSSTPPSTAMPGRSSTSRPPSRHRFATMANQSPPTTTSSSRSSVAHLPSTARTCRVSPHIHSLQVMSRTVAEPLCALSLIASFLYALVARSKTRPLHLHPHSTSGSNDENSNHAIPQRTSSLQQISALHWPGGGPIASAASRTFQSSPNDAVAGALQDLPDDVFAAIDDESMAELPVYEDSQASAIAAAAPTTMMTAANSSTHNTTTPRPRSELGMALQQHRPSLPANLSPAQSSRPTSTTGMGMPPPASQTRRSAPPTHTVSSPGQRNHGNRAAWPTSSPSGSHRSSSPTTDMALMPPPRGPAAVAAAAASTSHNGALGASNNTNRKASSPSHASDNAHALANANANASSSSANTNTSSAGVPPQSYAFRMVQRELSCAQAKNRRYLSVIDELERTVAMLKRGGGGAGGAAAAAAAEERVAAAAAALAAALAAEGGDDGRSPPSSGNGGR